MRSGLCHFFERHPRIRTDKILTPGGIGHCPAQMLTVRIASPAVQTNLQTCSGSHITNFDTSSQTAHPLNIGLQNIETPIFDHQLVGIRRVKMLATGKCQPRQAFLEFNMPPNIFRNQTLFHPAQIIRTQTIGQTRGIFHIKSHITIEHEIAIIANQLADLGYSPLVLSQSPQPINRTVLTGQLKRPKPQLLVPIHIIPRRVHKQTVARRTAQKLINRLALQFPRQIPQRQIHSTNRQRGNSHSPKSLRHAKHHIPQLFNCQAILPFQYMRESIFHHHSNRPSRRRTEAPGPIFSGHLNREPGPLSGTVKLPPRLKPRKLRHRICHLYLRGPRLSIPLCPRRCTC